MNRAVRTTRLLFAARKLLRAPSFAPPTRKAKSALLLCAVVAASFERDLHHALSAQDTPTLLRFVDELRQLIRLRSGEYRACVAQLIGALRGDDDDHVTERRVRADQLARELDELWVRFRMVGRAVLPLAPSDVAGAFERAEAALLEEWEANKRAELELLRAQYDRIVGAK